MRPDLKNELGLTLVSWLVIGAVITVMLSMVISMGTMGQKKNIADQTINFRDQLLKSLVLLGQSPRALYQTSLGVGTNDQTLDMCITGNTSGGGTSCSNGTSFPLDLYDTSNSLIAGGCTFDASGNVASGTPVYYTVGGSTCTSASTYCPIIATATFTPTCAPTNCNTAAGNYVVVTIKIQRAYIPNASSSPVPGLGGLIQPESMSSDLIPVSIITPPNHDTWASTTTTSAPAPRFGHTALWTGKQMLVWGGMGTSAMLNSGGLLSATGTWSSTTTSGAPAIRMAHSAVWTGSQMIIWGGEGSAGNFLNTGGVYDPSSDTWTTMTTSNAPSERHSSAAVWTGASLLVWGGYGGTGVGASLNDGYTYNPNLDSWTVVTTSSGPAVRWDFASVWTPTKMILWSGWDNASYLSNGYNYTLSSNAWSTITTSSQPSSRSSQAIWTGTKMYVWGGFNASSVPFSYLNDGSIYDPTTDAWTSITTTSAPSQRDGNSIVWSGTQLIVWGGENSGTQYNTGSLYTASTNKWTAMTTSSAPSTRFDHSAVWNGSQMIIWGGYPATNTGGSYNP